MAGLGTLASRLGPAVCDLSVTNVCNATCDFCAYAHDKQLVKDPRWIDRRQLAEAFPILRRRGIRYVNFQGGEPLLHQEIEGLVADARGAGLTPALITNGWGLPQKIDRLAAAGLRTLLVSIDSHAIEAHERNRGLRGVGERLRQGLAAARRHGLATLASVTVNRLVRYEALPELLRDLAIDAVTFSYPRRPPLGSTSMAYGDQSPLVDFSPAELVSALQEIQALKAHFPVLNPTASLEDIQRHVRGEPETFACVGGRKYFYLDWNLDLWRCETWTHPLGSVFDLDRIPDQRDRCTACMMSCYRDTSVLMHAGLAVEDALRTLAAGRIRQGGRGLFRPSVGRAVRAVLEGAGVSRR